MSAAVVLGLGTYFYFHFQQKGFEQATQTVQSSAFKAMQEKEKSNIGPQETQGTNTNDEGKSQISGQEAKVDYKGKDVKPLTLGAMKKVNVKKVVTNFGAGTIEIPDIGMKLPVLEGISQQNLSVGAGTMKPNQTLGKGNFALAGHYMTNTGLLFGGLKNVREGEQVFIEYKGACAAYLITSVQHITKENSQVISDTEGTGILTLITCDSATDGTSGRLMIRASLN